MRKYKSKKYNRKLFIGSYVIIILTIVILLAGTTFMYDVADKFGWDLERTNELVFNMLAYGFIFVFIENFVSRLLMLRVVSICYTDMLDVILWCKYNDNIPNEDYERLFETYKDLLTEVKSIRMTELSNKFEIIEKLEAMPEIFIDKVIRHRIKFLKKPKSVIEQEFIRDMREYLLFFDEIEQAIENI